MPQIRDLVAERGAVEDEDENALSVDVASPAMRLPAKDQLPWAWRVCT